MPDDKELRASTARAAQQKPSDDRWLQVADCEVPEDVDRLHPRALTHLMSVRVTGIDLLRFRLEMVGAYKALVSQVEQLLGAAAETREQEPDAP